MRPLACSSLPPVRIHVPVGPGGRNPCGDDGIPISSPFGRPPPPLRPPLGLRPEPRRARVMGVTNAHHEEVGEGLPIVSPDFASITALTLIHRLMALSPTTMGEVDSILEGTSRKQLESHQHLPTGGATRPNRGARAQYPHYMGGLLRLHDKIMDPNPKRRRITRNHRQGLPETCNGKVQKLSS